MNFGRLLVLVDGKKVRIYEVAFKIRTFIKQPLMEMQVLVDDKIVRIYQVAFKIRTFIKQTLMEMQEITNFERLSKYVGFGEMYEFSVCP